MSDFTQMPDGFEQREEKTYSVTLQEAQEVTITITGKAKRETRIFQVDATPNNGILALNEDNLADLMLSFEIDGKSTGDLTYQGFKGMISSETAGNADNSTDNLLLTSSRELDFGTEIKMSIWSTQHLNLFRDAVGFVGDDGYGRGDLDNWDHVILSEGNKKILKNTVTFNLEENLTVRFYLSDGHFEEARFDTDRSDILRQGLLYMGQGDSVPFTIWNGANKEITTLAELLTQKNVTLKVFGGSENYTTGYIAKNIKDDPNWQYKKFTVSSNGKTLSFTIDAQQTLGENNEPIYNLLFKNVPVDFPDGTELFWEKSLNRRVEVFKATWDDFQKAMDDNFVELPMNCKYDESVYDYFDYRCRQGLDNFDGLTFSGNYGDTKYVLKDQQVEYYFQFDEDAIGKKFRISLGSESKEITVTAETVVELTFNGGKILLKFLPQATKDTGEHKGEPLPTITATGKAQDFAFSGSELKIEVVG